LDDRIEVPLELEDFEIIGSEVQDGRLEVEIRSTRRPACHHCGSLGVSLHAVNERRVRDHACRYPTVLRWHQRRFRCSDCERTSRERHPEVAGRRSITNRFRHRLFERARNEPFADVAAGEAVSHYRVTEAFDWHATAELIAHQLDPLRVVSLDESAFKKRFHFHTVFSDPERGAIFDLTDGRSQASAQEGFAALDPKIRAGIETVVIDCFWPYRRAIEKCLPHARVVADKFHIIRAVDAAAQKVRVRHGRRRTVVGPGGGLHRSHNPRFLPHMWRARWTFMKRAHKLTSNERAELAAIFEQRPEVGVAWLLKEEFAAIYEAADRAEAERRLEVWVDHIAVADLREFTELWRNLQWWAEPILAYFEDRVSNAFAEGITNKIKVMKRRSYGFRDPIRYRHKVLLSCRRRSSRHG
jgi:transposase